MVTNLVQIFIGDRRTVSPKRRTTTFAIVNFEMEDPRLEILAAVAQNFDIPKKFTVSSISSRHRYPKCIRWGRNGHFRFENFFRSHISTFLFSVNTDLTGGIGRNIKCRLQGANEEAVFAKMRCHVRYFSFPARKYSLNRCHECFVFSHF